MSTTFCSTQRLSLLQSLRPTTRCRIKGRSDTRLQADSTQSRKIVPPTGIEYVADADGFSFAKVSFGSILSPIGVGLMVYGFFAYFDFLPGE